MAAYFCPHCRVMTTFSNPLGSTTKWNHRIHALWNCNNCGGVVYASIVTEPDDVRMYPFVRSDAPEEYPEDVRNNFAEAIRSMNAGNPKSAVIMARSALQAATRQQGAKGHNLKEEIDNLAEIHIIPDPLKEWAHQIRDGGNLVGHPEPDKGVDMADAEELMALAESIFEYLYVIPAHVQRRRDRLAGAREEAEPSVDALQEMIHPS